MNAASSTSGKQTRYTNATTKPFGHTVNTNRPQERNQHAWPISGWLGWMLLSQAAIGMVGCASITNPVANGIPARLVPPELLAASKEGLVPIPLNWLRRKPLETYTLDKGDILGVYIEGVLGEEDQLPPIHFPDVAGLPPSVGFPIPIRENGTVPLPLVEPVNVKGMTIEEAQDAIVEAYTVQKQIVKPDEARILVTLVSPRLAKILVIREDTPNSINSQFSELNSFSRAAPVVGRRGQGSGSILELPATEADVLRVLASTGGLPGPSAANEVVIQRGYGTESGWPVLEQLKTCEDPRQLMSLGTKDEASTESTVRIPLRWPEGVDPPFESDDILLSDGDIVFIPATDFEFYYTGGLLPSRELSLPRDYDLRVLEAVLRIGGPFINGGVNSNNLSGGIVGSGLGNPSPSLMTILRRTPNGGQINIRVDLNRAAQDPRENLLVQAGDRLVLQETPSEAMARYFAQTVNFSFLGTFLNRADATGTAAATVP